MFKHNGNVIRVDLDLVIGEGETAITIPAVSLQDPATRAHYGITEEPDDPRPDDRYYFVHENDDGTFSKEPKDLDGLKKWRVGEIKATAASLLQPTSWMIERANDPSSGKPVPSDVLAYRAAVREASNVAEAAINACTTVDALAALQTAWPKVSA